MRSKINSEKINKKIIIATICVFIGVVSASCYTPSEQTSSSNNTQITKQEQTTQENTQTSTTQQSVVEKTTSPKDVEWDTTNLYVNESTNLEKAVQILQSMSETDIENQTAIDIDITTASKKPWEYYGEFVNVSGYVSLIQAYPPNSDVSKNLGTDGTTTEIVILSEDGTSFADYFFIGDASDIAVDSYITVSGLPCGLLDVPNTMGGTYPYFVVVGMQEPEILN